MAVTGEQASNEAATQAGAQVVQQLGEIPFGDLLAAMGRGLAEAQLALDRLSSLVALTLTGHYQLAHTPEGAWTVVPQDSRIAVGGESLSLLELGFSPTFYQFVDTLLEIKVSISMTLEQSSREEVTSTARTERSWTEGGFLGIGGTRRTQMNTTTVSSQLAARFQYSAEGASLVRTKLAPLPPPPGLARLLRELGAPGAVQPAADAGQFDTQGAR